jgi:GTP diphosphokinase / guanosine-3',5'-bis(diphosphate) 3'-diphosphatase
MNRKFDKLLAKINQYNKKADFEKIKKAYFLAKKAHKNQKRLSGEDFIDHPLQVALFLADWGLDSGSIIAGILHDTVEDSEVNLEEIKKEFGEDIALLVDGVTKIGDIKFKGGKDDLFVENLRKMIVVMAKDLRVVLIKLADRLHNSKSLYVFSEKKQKRIARETLEIYAPLAERLGIGVAKGELEDLAFSYLLKKEFEFLKKLSRPFYKNADLRVKKMRRKLLKNLAKEKIKSEVHGRKKHFYSLYKKLNREEKDNDISRIHDLVALRVICNTIEDCYRVLGIVHKIYKPVPVLGVRDFIAQPKPNGYQSIHTNVFGENGEITEIQIRTFRMHEEAEKGVAAHWQYSEKKTKETSNKKIDSGFFAPDEKINWVKDLMAWQEEISDSKEFLNSLKFDALRERNFIFSPKGDVFDLPKDATPVDFAYAIHTWLGDHCVGARVNEKFVGLDFKLESGQMVEIITDKNKKGPSKDWLSFAVTKLARSRISRCVKND